MVGAASLNLGEASPSLSSCLNARSEGVLLNSNSDTRMIRKKMI
jgi:hypothetical protein